MSTSAPTVDEAITLAKKSKSRPHEPPSELARFYRRGVGRGSGTAAGRECGFEGTWRRIVIRDDAATQEAIELYLIVDANGPIMPTIDRIAERLRSFTQSPSGGDTRRLSPPDDDPAARRGREGLIQLIESV